MKNISKVLFFTLFFHIQIKCKIFTIMLNPAGDAKDAGRMLIDSFERGVTLQFAQELKKSIESNFQNIRVVLTRIPGESLEFLQNANFSNRLNVDFYLSLHFYKENESVPKVFLYHYLTDTFYTKQNMKLHFYNFDNAHLIHISKTLKYCDLFRDVFNQNSYKNQFDFVGPLGIPFRPLIGIKSPALAIEIGIKNTIDSQIYIKPIIETISKILNEQ